MNYLYEHNFSRIVTRISNSSPLSLLVVMIILFIPSLTTTQQQNVLQGKVIDLVSREPVAEANLLIQGTSQGTTTDESGNFKLTTQGSRLILEISHIAYQKNILEIDLRTSDQPLTILLTPSAYELQEAIITGKRGNVYSVMDYEFLEGNLLQLVYNHRKARNELLLLSHKYDTLAQLTHLPHKRAGNLFKDCLGQNHFIGREKAYQIIFSEAGLQLNFETDLVRFQKLMDHCQFEFSDYLVFRRKSFNPFEHTFFAVHENSHEVIELISRVEREKAFALQDELNFINRHSETFSRAGMALARQYAQKIAFKPAENFLERIGDSIYFFNHGSGSIEVFDQNLNFIRETKITYHLDENWEPLLLIDEVKGSAFTVILSGQKKKVYEINLKNGSIEIRQTIPLSFPEKLSVRNGQLFFLYKDTGNIWARKKLFRIALSQVDL